MKKLLTALIALSTLSAPALARDHWGRGYDRGHGRDYGYVHAPRGYDRAYYGGRHGYYAPRYYGGRGYYGCRGSNADGTQSL